MEKGSAVVSETELPYVLIEAGAKLQTPPENVEEVLAVLDSFEDLLGSVGQAPPYPIRHALVPAIRGLISDKLFRHGDMDVKISVLSCIHELIRISAPDAPYEDDSMKEIFLQTVIAFEQLSLFSGRGYNKAVQILETVSKIRSFLMLLDLGCDELVIQMFQQLLGAIQSNHPDTIFSYMEDLMTWLIEETDKISLDLLRPLLVSVRKENQNISPPSWRLAAKVLKNCSARVKPCLVEGVEQMSQDIEAFTDIVASILPDMPAGENVAKEGERGATDIVPMPGDGTAEQREIHQSSVVDTVEGSEQVERLLKVSEDSAKPDALERRGELKAQPSLELLSRRRGRKPYSKAKLEEGYEFSGVSCGTTSSKVSLKRKKKKNMKDVVVNNMKDFLHDHEMKDRTAQDCDVEHSLPRNSKKPRNFKDYPEDLIGSRVMVWWPKDRKFYEGVVQSYDPNTKKHKVVHIDGVVETLTLSRERWEVLDDISTKVVAESEKGAFHIVPMPADGTTEQRGIHKSSLVGTLVGSEQVEQQQLLKVSEDSAKPDALERRGELNAQSSREVLPRRRGRKPFSYRKIAEGNELSGGSCGRTSSEVSWKRKNEESMRDVVVKNKEDFLCDYEIKDFIKDGTAQERGAEESLPRNSKKPRNFRDCPEDLIGSRVKVWWPKDKKFYEGVVQSYEPNTKKHKVVYFDGDVETLNLRREHWKLLDDISTKELFRKKEKKISTGGQEANLPSSAAVSVDSVKERARTEDKHKETQEIAGLFSEKNDNATNDSSKESFQPRAEKRGDTVGAGSTQSIFVINSEVDISKEHDESGQQGSRLLC